MITDVHHTSGSLPQLLLDFNDVAESASYGADLESGLPFNLFGAVDEVCFFITEITVVDKLVDSHAFLS